MKPCVALLALAFAAACPPLAAQPEDSRIEFEQCDLQLPGTTVTAEARCGGFEVPENPAAPGGRQIRLHVAVAPARARTPEPDPLFFFAGGPGQAASEYWPVLRVALREVNRERDIVLVDQRGTGRSNPLDCPMPDEALDDVLDLEFVRQWTAECRERLDADLAQYTTPIAARDFDLVREAMGYERINIAGVSYGTRMAQVYLRLFPERVRSVVLDSVAPMDLHLGAEHAVSLQQALHAVLADCAADPDCAGRFPDLESRLDALTRSLRDAPRTLSVVHPVTGEIEPMLMDADTLAVAVRMLAYQSQTQAMLPLLLHEATSDAQEGQRDPLARLAQQALIVLQGLGEQISRGLELSVVCAEDLPGLQRDPAAADTLLGETMYDVMETQCAEWPAGTAPADFRAPVVSEVPVLLLSGERDPVTPPRYADRVAGHLPNSLHLVAAGQGHSVMGNACLREIVAEFVAEASVSGLDTGCVDDIQASPYFTTLLGPEP